MWPPGATALGVITSYCSQTEYSSASQSAMQTDRHCRVPDMVSLPMGWHCTTQTCTQTCHAQAAARPKANSIEIRTLYSNAKQSLIYTAPLPGPMLYTVQGKAIMQVFVCLHSHFASTVPPQYTVYIYFFFLLLTYPLQSPRECRLSQNCKTLTHL